MDVQQQGACLGECWWGSLMTGNVFAWLFHVTCTWKESTLVSPPLLRLPVLLARPLSLWPCFTYLCTKHPFPNMTTLKKSVSVWEFGGCGNRHNLVQDVLQWIFVTFLQFCDLLISPLVSKSLLLLLMRYLRNLSYFCLHHFMHKQRERERERQRQRDRKRQRQREIESHRNKTLLWLSIMWRIKAIS